MWQCGYQHGWQNETLMVAMNVISTKLGEIPVLEAWGDIDHNTCGSVETALNDAVSAGNNVVFIDLRRVAYIDSGGLSVLLSGVRLLRERGWLGVIGPNANVRRLLEIVGLLVDPGFRVFEDAETALATASKRMSA